MSNCTQHTRPCATCPFTRKITPGALGGSQAPTYIGQSVGPFWLPCHERYLTPDPMDNKKTPQCAGAAIYRANVKAPPMPAPLLTLPEDTKTVFASHAEFFAHHEKIPLVVAETFLLVNTPATLMRMEMFFARQRRGEGAAARPEDFL